MSNVTHIGPVSPQELADGLQKLINEGKVKNCMVCIEGDVDDDSQPMAWSTTGDWKDIFIMLAFLDTNIKEAFRDANL